MTPEDKARIEAEEQARFAEEAYRRKVRSELQNPHGAVPWGKLAAGGLTLAVITGAVVWMAPKSAVNTSGTPQATAAPPQQTASVPTASVPPQPIPSTVTPTPAPPPAETPVEPPPPMRHAITHSRVKVGAMKKLVFTFDVPPAWTNARLRGRFDAVGGKNDDIAVMITAESSDAVLWASTRRSSGVVNIPISPGRHRLILNNGFSFLAEKIVRADFDVIERPD